METNKEKPPKKATKPKELKIKSEELLQNIEVHVDPSILSAHFGSQILNYLNALGGGGVPVQIEPQILPNVITWNLKPMSKLDQEMQTIYNDGHEKMILYVMPAKEFHETLSNSIFLAKFRNMSTIYSAHKITLLICGNKDHTRNRIQPLSDRMFWEKQLALLQLDINICHRFLETAADLAHTVKQFTKSIAEYPLKRLEAKKLEQFKFYILNDKKKCVAIKGTAGLANLWQRNLMKLPLVSLEIAEAITGVYPMPKALFDVYNNSQTNGSQLLANIPIRRSRGPLKSVRKIGPKLSEKIHLLYTSSDADLILRYRRNKS